MHTCCLLAACWVVGGVDAQRCDNRCKEAVQKAEDQLAGDEEAEEGEDLCDCEFSLAYGAKILLNNAKLHLKRGKIYGLCGPNGAGKVCLCCIAQVMHSGAIARADGL